MRHFVLCVGVAVCIFACFQSKDSDMTEGEWFSNAGGFTPAHDIAVLEKGIAAGLTDRQDEWGMTALALCVSSGWVDGVKRLLAAGADTEKRYYRTGETALSMAVQNNHGSLIALLVEAGANPDAANYYGVTPRKRNPTAFESIPSQPVEYPAVRLQDAEHLADHYHPKFETPSRQERDSLQVGQAVALYVYGPKQDGKSDSFKVRITERQDTKTGVRYVANVETPIEETHLAAGTTSVSFGPEHVATVFVRR